MENLLANIMENVAIPLLLTIIGFALILRANLKKQKRQDILPFKDYSKEEEAELNSPTKSKSTSVDSIWK